MGIYNNGKVYGIKWLEDESFIVVYEYKSDSPLTDIEIQLISKHFIETRDLHSKCRFYCLSNCTSTYDFPPTSFMQWEEVDMGDILVILGIPLPVADIHELKLNDSGDLSKLGDASTIVIRDASGNFYAEIINFEAELDVLKAQM